MSHRRPGLRAPCSNHPFLIARMVPEQPSDCRYLPEPVPPVMCPVLTTVIPPAVLTARTAPFGLTVPDRPLPPLIRPPEIAADPVPAAAQPAWSTTVQFPSNLATPPPPPCGDDRRVCRALRLRPSGRSGLAECGSCTAPDRVFSLLPILPPVLSARARSAPAARAIAAQIKAVFAVIRSNFHMRNELPKLRDHGLTETGTNNDNTRELNVAASARQSRRRRARGAINRRLQNELEGLVPRRLFVRIAGLLKLRPDCLHGLISNRTSLPKCAF
jgi:hypothetical protein